MRSGSGSRSGSTPGDAVHAEVVAVGEPAERVVRGDDRARLAGGEAAPELVVERDEASVEARGVPPVRPRVVGVDLRERVGDCGDDRAIPDRVEPQVRIVATV